MIATAQQAPISEILRMRPGWQKMIDLVCSAELAQAAQDYTRELDEYAWKLKKSGWKGLPGLTKREHKLRVQFMETARRELGGMKANCYEDVRETTPRIQKSLSCVKYLPTANG